MARVAASGGDGDRVNVTVDLIVSTSDWDYDHMTSRLSVNYYCVTFRSASGIANTSCHGHENGFDRENILYVADERVHECGTRRRSSSRTSWVTE